MRLSTREQRVNFYPRTGRRGPLCSVRHPADIVRRVMAGDQNPLTPTPPGAGEGWTALAYLISGMLVWGFAGWALDHWWLHSGGIAVAVGLIIGLAGAVYLIAKRSGV